MIAGLAYNPSLALFFHYYGHLWHLTCKAARGKVTLISDIDSLNIGSKARPSRIAEEDEDVVLVPGTPHGPSN